jgi:S1-C subfamily serine protease
MIAVLALLGVAEALPSAEVVANVSRSVFLLECFDASGGVRGRASAFAWGAADRAVTAMHAVAGCSRMELYSPPRAGARRARVTRVLAARDLVELQIEPPTYGEQWSVTPLSASRVQPRLWQEFAVIGHPVGLRVAEPSRLTWSRRSALSSWVPKSVLQRLSLLKWLDTSTEVHSFSGGHIAPGHSGAPIIDDAGSVVAIAQGGLASGAIEIGWGLPVNLLQALTSSTIRTLPSVEQVDTLFSAGREATLVAEDSPRVRCGDLELVLVRSASLAEMAPTSDDPAGLQTLLTTLSTAGQLTGQTLDPLAFRYDLWRDLETGATVPVPAGLQPAERGRDCVVNWTGSGVGMTFRVERAGDFAEATANALAFENSIAQGRPGQIDPAFSYLVPINRWDGLIVNRKAALLWTWWPTGPQPSTYVFQTLATKSAQSASSSIEAAVTKDWMDREAQACMMGWYAPECRPFLERHQGFAQMVIAVHLAGFPYG